MNYEILDHTADAKFMSYGETMEDAFANAVPALTEIATTEKVAEKRTINFEIESKTKEALLFDFINHIIFLIDTEGFLAGKAESLEIVESDSGYKLFAILAGDDVKKYGSNLKAATYSEMFVEQKNDKWVLCAVVDI